MTGKLFEYDFCGGIADSISDTPEYKSWRKALAEVTSKFTKDADANPCKWDVSDPDGICSDLFYYVATALGVDVMADLCVYPAFGTAFDVFHGVDLFFIYEGCLCTVDLTINPNKVDGYKADVVVSPETDLVWMGEVIAEKLKRKMDAGQVCPT
jgi:hypothetical protein